MVSKLETLQAEVEELRKAEEELRRAEEELRETRALTKYHKKTSRVRYDDNERLG